MMKSPAIINNAENVISRRSRSVKSVREECLHRTAGSLVGTNDNSVEPD